MWVESKTFQKILRHLDITPNEAKVYLTLVLQGPLTAKKLAELSGVPYTKIYSVVRKLEKRGFIEIHSEQRPEQIVAVSPLTVLEKIKSDLEEKLRQAEKFFRLLEEYYVVSHEGRTVEKPVLLIQGRKSAISFVKKIINSAREFTYIASPFLEKEVASIVSELKTPAKMLVTENTRYIVDQLLKLAPPGVSIQVRIKDKMFGFGVISEKEIILIVKDKDVIRGMYSTCAYFVDIARVYFEYLWSDATPIT